MAQAELERAKFQARVGLMGGRKAVKTSPAGDKTAAVLLDSPVCLSLTSVHFKALDRLLNHRRIAVVFVDCRPTLKHTEKRIKG